MTSRRFSTAICCFALAVVSSAGRAQSDPFPVEVDPAVARTIDAMTVTPPASPLRRADVQVTHPAGTEPSVSISYQALGKNVWSVTAEQTVKNGLFHARTLSLCGLVDLARRTNSELRIENTVSVPVGRIFLPFGSEVTKKLTAGARTTTLTLGEGAENICAPSPGAQFAFSINAEMEPIHATSSHSDPKKISYGVDMKCQADQIKPAAELGRAWSGSYVPVTCTGNNLASGKSSTSKWAFVIGSGFYLPLETTSETGRTSHTYIALELAPGA
jgi:hypothetical protein